MAEFLVASIESAGVGAQKPFHAGHQIGLWRLNDQMKVVGHQIIGVDLPTGFSASLPKRVHKAFSVLVVGEYFLVPVAPVHDVVKRARVLDAKLAGGRKTQFWQSSLVACFFVENYIHTYIFKP